MATAWLGWFVTGHGGGGDFAIFRQAGRDVAHGRSPYVRPTLELLATNDRFVYPTPFAIPFVPFALMPERVAATVFLLLSIAAIVAALWLLGVRDWRCYGASLLSIPVFGSLGLGTIGPFLLLLCAMGWRLREHSAAGVPIALAATSKLFLWPLLLWLLVTRRLRASVAALATLACTLAVWAMIDFEGLLRYPQTIRLLNDVQRWKSYSVQSLLVMLHLPGSARDVIVGLVAVTALGAMVALRHSEDERTFAAAVVLAIIATPILWTHYLVLLVAPIAIAKPRLAPLWLIPIALWATPHPEAAGVAWRVLFVQAAIIVVAGRTVWPGASSRQIPADAAHAESTGAAWWAPDRKFIRVILIATVAVIIGATVAKLVPTSTNPAVAARAAEIARLPIGVQGWRVASSSWTRADQRAWFRQAPLGLLIAYGPSSKLAAQSDGQWWSEAKSERGRANGETFNPNPAAADTWVNFARRLGASYLVFTAKHHDGFGLWATRTTLWAVPPREDLLARLAKDARRARIRLFVYYSLVDWHDATYKHDDAAYLRFVKAQLRELLTDYGPLAGVWFDGSWDGVISDRDVENLFSFVHALQPWAIVGDNSHRAPVRGADFQIFEDGLPSDRETVGNAATGRLPLQSVVKLGKTWFWDGRPDPTSAGTFRTLRRRARLAHVSLLVNVAPDPRGRIPLRTQLALARQNAPRDR